MRAVVIRSFGGPEVLEIAEVAVPEPGHGQVRIRVAAAGVNPVDAQTRSGALVAAGILPAPPVPRRATGAGGATGPGWMTGIGFDVAGTVDAVGTGVTGFTVGEPVIGLSDRVALPLKAQAEYVVLDADAVGSLPPGVDPVGAATLPLNGLTAAQALDLLGPGQSRPGRTLLVTGAAGGVGGYVVELASRRGWRVTAVASARDGQLVRELGAEHVVPRGADLATEVRARVPGGVDAAVDAARLGITALDAVKGGGDFVALLGGAPVPLRGIRVSNVWIRADGHRLTELAAAGLRYRVADTLPLTRVRAAHERLAVGGLRGRLVLLP